MVLSEPENLFVILIVYLKPSTPTFCQRPFHSNLVRRYWQSLTRYPSWRVFFTRGPKSRLPEFLSHDRWGWWIVGMGWGRTVTGKKISVRCYDNSSRNARLHISLIFIIMHVRCATCISFIGHRCFPGSWGLKDKSRWCTKITVSSAQSSPS